MKSEEILDDIIGKKICFAGRCAGMLSIDFDNGSEKDVNTEKKEEIALHVQTTWRMVNDTGVLFASSDIFEPSSSNADNEDFDWDVQDANLFDEKLKLWLSNSDYYVASYELGKCGDLVIHFTNGDRLEIIVNETGDVECWRIFQIGNLDRHIVINGTGIETE